MENSPKTRGGFFGKDYIVALEKHYPEFVAGDVRESVDAKLHIGFVDAWRQRFDEVGVDAENRFESLAKRAWTVQRNAWEVSGGSGDVRTVAAYGSYKGLIRLKPAVDLVLYSNLIWELQPKTIIEFGSLQGGSALWFADQLDALCGEGEVHSFELCLECIHPRASHPRLHFHEADLTNLETLDEDLFRRLPHPWLVVDDAHVNWDRLLSRVAGLMQPNDYYVVEDMFVFPTADIIEKAVTTCESAGLAVDTKYTDAFGFNLTCSSNGWLCKTSAGAAGREGKS